MDSAELLDNLRKLDPEVSQILAKHFDLKKAAPFSQILQEERHTSRQAASKLIAKLVDQGLLTEGPRGRTKTYSQPILFKDSKTFELSGLEEHVVWAQHFRPVFVQYMGAEALDVWEYGFNEMLNNAIDHSQGKTVQIHASIRAGVTSVWMSDDGEGIFKRITRLLSLIDERQAILELAKGKLTTDPDNHSGEGVFFSARAFDCLAIESAGLWFDHRDGEDDWLFEHDRTSGGTSVLMEHGNHTKRVLRTVFEEFAVPDEFTFSKTIVPVRLARFGHEGLISRSQAQRLLARVDRFKIVLFDFDGVDNIGQAFADEIFRVYANKHPEVELVPIHASEQVTHMVTRATAMH